jgi:HK97 family phage prohead protease
MTGVESRRHELAGQLKGTLERRQFQTADLELRESSDGAIRMSGYGSVTEHEYDIGDPERSGFVEVIKRGAFRRTIGESPAVSLLFGHSGMPYASTRNNSLVLEEDTRGLHWHADLDGEDGDSRVLARKVQQGLITECSFAFQVTGENWSSDFRRREITSVSLHRGDISLVVEGANPATSVSLRAKRNILVPDYTSGIRAEFDLMRAKMELEEARARSRR